MKRPKSTGLFVLGIYLVAIGLMKIVGIRLGHDIGFGQVLR